MSTANGIYFKKRDVSDEDYWKFIRTYTEDSDLPHLYNVLARYIISQGDDLPRLNKKNLYKYFSAKLNVHVRNNKQKIWLCQLARAIERNEHKPFKIEELEIKIPGDRK